MVSRIEHRLTRDGINLPGKARYLSGSVPAVDCSFVGCLLDYRNRCSQGRLGLFYRLFIDGDADTLDGIFYQSTA